MEKNPFKISLFFTILFLLASCGNNKKIDVSNINAPIIIKRFDKDLARIKPEEVASKLPQLQKKYGLFYTDYFEKVLNVGNTKDTQYYALVREILAGKPLQDLQKETDSIYPDFDLREQEIEMLFKHIKYYYPKTKTPEIVTYISGFQVQAPIGQGYLGIGLDMFLGKNSKFYPALIETIPMYISRRFTPENIAPRVAEVMAREELFPEQEKDNTLLAKMIYNGKILYFLDRVLPETADSLKIGYSSKQMDWANAYESDIWAYFLDQDLLYNSDYLKFQKYISEAPFTPGFGENNESAPKLAIFTGWKMVRKYMEENPEITLQQLMAEKDEQKILKMAKYRPTNK